MVCTKETSSPFLDLSSSWKAYILLTKKGLLIGLLSKENGVIIIRMLHCSYLFSYLKLILYKSQIMVIGVNQSVIHQMIASIGRVARKFLFTYLGLLMGKYVFVTCKLSNWKVKSLSVGGRLTLLKSVFGALPTYFISLLRLRKVFL
uniref:Uncharacterized protein n=1 Tax=Lactuca sativa TaxID=4236 RepID=A0A9R1WGU7_LACSA|nr:hypothetical protein LSAT_V11C200076920 [Lactuca sativa]